MRKPGWLRTRLPSGEVSRDVDRLLANLNLHTVCSSARCPNLGECWGRGTATFMILGDICTRHCKFCAVGMKGDTMPHRVPFPVDETEPQRVAEAVRQLRLRYVVLTSVDRDDLPELGAAQFAATIRAIRHPHAQFRNLQSSILNLQSSSLVEVLIPDFDARQELLELVIDAEPDVLGHNLETIEALTPAVRDPRADYRQSLEVLRRTKAIRLGQITKSGIMVGLGETPDQIRRTLHDLHEVRTDIVTIGQYLQPTHHNLPVVEYVTPEQFSEYDGYARQLGFSAVFAGPLVRSSYHAAELSGERGHDAASCPRDESV